MEHNNVKPENNKHSSGTTPRKTPKRITDSYLHNAGLYYLERFAASTQQFRTVMLRKITKSCLYHEDQDMENCAAKLEVLITKFQNIDLLNDDVYTRAVVTSLRRRGLSARAIQARLRSKGVSEQLVKTHLETEETDDFVAALRFCRRKRFGAFRTKNFADPQQLQKFQDKSLASLARAGFSYDISKTVLNLDLESAERQLHNTLC